MDPVSAVLGMIATIPQCIESAKKLYDLRERFNQASFIISAIYTESMVVAASLSQIQSLLHGTTLQNKPELRETLDRALTGCWVVYQCLDEEVRDLVRKVEENDLRNRDRARFLLKEENFKELLQQIRGQQSALVLLIQGLQMESLADVRRLVGDNSMKLDRIAKRSKTLREKHPNIGVPDSVLEKDSINETQSLFADAEFAFDDEVVNSKAYRRAMAQAAARGSAQEPKEKMRAIEEDLIDLNSVKNEPDDDDQTMVDCAVAGMKTPMLQVDVAIESHDSQGPAPEEGDSEGANAGILDHLEKNMLPFMPTVCPSPKPSLVATETDATSLSQESFSLATAKSIEAADKTPPASISEKYSEEKIPSIIKDETENPPLPPRRPAPPMLAREMSNSSSQLKKISSWEEISSPLSSKSSLSLTDPYSGDVTPRAKHKITRKPLPSLTSKPSNWSLQSSATGEQPAMISTKEIDPRMIWASILSDEEDYIQRLDRFCTAFYDSVINDWPILKNNLEALTLAKQLITLHQEHILDVVKEQIREGSGICNSHIFITWAGKSYRVLKEYAQRYPNALYALRLTRSRDKRFTPFVETLGLSLTYFGKTWEDYLLLPITQLDTYITKLQSLASLAQSSYLSNKDQKRSKDATDVLQRLRAQCLDLIEQSTNREEIQSLSRRLHTADYTVVDILDLPNPDRQIVYQGPLAIKINGHGPWLSVHAVLLDNFLVWGKIKPSKGKNQMYTGDSLTVSELPVPVANMSVRFPVDLNHTPKMSFLDEFAWRTSLYELFVDVKRERSKTRTHIIAAISQDERKTWYRKLSAAAEA